MASGSAKSKQILASSKQADQSPFENLKPQDQQQQQQKQQYHRGNVQEEEGRVDEGRTAGEAAAAGTKQKAGSQKGAGAAHPEEARGAQLKGKEADKDKAQLPQQQQQQQSKQQPKQDVKAKDEGSSDNRPSERRSQSHDREGFAAPLDRMGEAASGGSVGSQLKSIAYKVDELSNHRVSDAVKRTRSYFTNTPPSQIAGDAFTALIRVAAILISYIVVAVRHFINEAVRCFTNFRVCSFTLGSSSTLFLLHQCALQWSPPLS